MLALGGKKSLELLSIVVPCFNEEATIPIFFKTVERIRGQIQADRYRILFCRRRE